MTGVQTCALPISIEISLYLKVNIESLLFLSNKFINLKKKSEYFKIINISSRAAYKGYKYGSIYSGSKAFINNFSESLSKDLLAINKNVTVNTICPSALVSLEEIGRASCRERV